MKKRLLFVAAIFAATATFAQDGLTSKKGEAYLPEAGDWAIGFNGIPFLEYAGNAFNGTNGSNTLAPNWIGNNNNTPNTLYGKFFKDEKTAYRLSLNIGMGGTTTKTFQDSAMGTAPLTNPVENTVTNSDGFSFVVGAGLEKRKGNTRIQGYYGGEILIGFLGGNSVKNEYGFAMDSVNVAEGDATSGRITEQKDGSRFTMGLRGFIGVEWFVAPKVSLGAEYGWGFAMNKNTTSVGEGETTKENWNATTNTASTSTTKTGAISDWKLGTDNGGARINIMFHF